MTEYGSQAVIPDDVRGDARARVYEILTHELNRVGVTEVRFETERYIGGLVHRTSEFPECQRSLLEVSDADSYVYPDCDEHGHWYLRRPSTIILAYGDAIASPEGASR
jgi:hypothetical protein